jgi:hypothetical protein
MLFNRKTAKALGIDISPTLLATADNVIRVATVCRGRIAIARPITLQFRRRAEAVGSSGASPEAIRAAVASR